MPRERRTSAKERNLRTQRDSARDPLEGHGRCPLSVASSLELEHEARHLLVLREALEARLRKDAAPVDVDLEHAARPRNEVDLDARVSAPEFSGQTVRLGRVVSLCAVFDTDAHGGGSGRSAGRVGPRARVSSQERDGEIGVRSQGSR